MNTKQCLFINTCFCSVQNPVKLHHVILYTVYNTVQWKHHYTAKKVSQIRTLTIVTLIEHLKVFCLHTPSVSDFKHNMNFEHIMFTNHIVFISLEHFLYANVTEYFQMFDKCYNFQCSNLGHFVCTV